MAQLIIHIDDDVLNKIRIHGLNFDSKYIRHVEKSILDAPVLTDDTEYEVFMISKDELIQVLEEFLENLKNNNDEKNWMIKPFIYIGALSLMKFLNDKFDLGLKINDICIS